MSLLTKALATKSVRGPKTKITDEHIELAIAWIKREVTTKQCTAALGYKPNAGSMAYTKLASAIRVAYDKGLVKFK